jgi:glycerol-3-phosphate dehydrogenase (NAD(P)+)
MAVITVIGAGVMGTALTYPAADNGHQIRLVGTHLDDDIIQSCQTDRYHPRLKRSIPEGVTPCFHSEIKEAVDDADVIVLGVNSRGVHWAADTVGPHLKPGQITLMVTKGMERGPDGSLWVLPDVFRAGLPEVVRDQIYYAAIGGPSIAGELAAKRHTAVVFASRTAEILPGLQSLFATPYYHIWTSTDLIGVEVCVAMKNVYALTCGLVAGMLERSDPDEADARMHNAAAALFAQGLSETAVLVKRLGGNLETVFSLPGAGDLYVTTQGGRNSRMGRLLGLGMTYSDAVEEMPGETVEGVDAVIAITPTIIEMMEHGKLPANAMPLVTRMYEIITRHIPADFDFDSFFGQLSFTSVQKI